MPQSRGEMMRAIHGHYASGEWIRGIDVFVAAYAAVDLDCISRAHAFNGETAYGALVSMDRAQSILAVTIWFSSSH